MRPEELYFGSVQGGKDDVVYCVRCIVSRMSIVTMSRTMNVNLIHPKMYSS